jgi:hypothetical protein
MKHLSMVLLNVHGIEYRSNSAHGNGHCVFKEMVSHFVSFTVYCIGIYQNKLKQDFSPLAKR